MIVVQPCISEKLDTPTARTVTASQTASLQEVERALRQVSDSKVKLSNPAWVSRYRVHHRLAKQYGVNRVFLADDVAHIHSPAGGQGMNTGLQDAANLVWKLVLAIRGHDPLKLLATYNSERRPIGENLLASTDRIFGMVSSPSRWGLVVRNVVFLDVVCPNIILE